MMYKRHHTLQVALAGTQIFWTTEVIDVLIS